MKKLYLDCFSGISGDMMVGALLDAGCELSYLEEQLKKLGISDEYKLEINNINKNGIMCKKFDVKLVVNAKSKKAHHRTYKDIVKMIKSSSLNDEIKTISCDIFKNIGKAEGAIHGVPLEKVHFHEVGAIDSIIDIVGVAILIDYFKVEKIYSTPIPVGSGSISIDHGIYPVPAPATLELLKGIPIAKSEINAELTTPTGAAFAKSLVDEFTSFPNMVVGNIGYGAGTKTFKSSPNAMRVMLGS